MVSFLKKYLSLIEGWLLYNTILVSATCQYESLIGTHMPPPCSTSHPIPPLYVVTEPEFEFPESHSKFPLAILHMTVYMFLCYSLHSSYPLLLPPTPDHNFFIHPSADGCLNCLHLLVYCEQCCCKHEYKSICFEYLLSILWAYT